MLLQVRIVHVIRLYWYYVLYTVPKDSKNFVADNNVNERLVSVTKVFVIDS
jgi:hypothetical protein